MERLTSSSTGQKFCEYPPNCLQFRALCLAFYEDLRLPKTHDAYLEIKNRAHGANNAHWSHQVVKYTAMRLPKEFHDIEHEHITYNLFKKAYEQVCTLVKQGHEVSVISETVTLSKPPNKHWAHEHLRQMKRQLGVL